MFSEVTLDVVSIRCIGMALTKVSKSAFVGKFMSRKTFTRISEWNSKTFLAQKYYGDY